MNVLDRDARLQVLKLMCLSMGIRQIVEFTGHSPNTVRRLLARFGEALAASHDRLIRNLHGTSRVEVDELWSFVYAKRHTKVAPDSKTAPLDLGAFYTWTALDPDSKLFVSWHVGKRTQHSGVAFFTDLRSRLRDGVMITSDGFEAYPDAIQRTFGADAVHVVLKKEIKGWWDPVSGDSGQKIVSLEKIPQGRVPENLTLASTSLVERLNGTIRNMNVRFTRKTYKFSKKLENHVHAFAIFAMNYNFVKAHTGLPKGERHLTPAMKAGLTDRVWSYGDLLDEVDEYWRRKAIQPVLQTVPKADYTPLGPAEWSDRSYFVSFSPKKRIAKVHASHCRDCRRAAAGRKEGPRANLWYAFQTEQGARKCAETLSPLDHSVCSICVIGHYAGGIATGRGSWHGQ